MLDSQNKPNGDLTLNAKAKGYHQNNEQTKQQGKKGKMDENWKITETKQMKPREPGYKRWHR